MTRYHNIPSSPAYEAPAASRTHEEAAALRAHEATAASSALEPAPHWDEPAVSHSLSRARRKLASTTGASLAFALAVFGVAAIFCIAIVNVALSSAGNAIDQAADEQDFLAASSAAKLVQELVPGKEVTFTSPAGGAGGGDTFSFTVDETAGNAAPILQAMGDARVSGASKEVKLAVGNSDDFPDVTLKLIPSSDEDSFDMTAVARSAKGNTITISLVADVEQGASSKTVTWEIGTIGK